MPKISLRDALRDALHEEMARDETIIVLGEDVIMTAARMPSRVAFMKNIPSVFGRRPSPKPVLLARPLVRPCAACVRWRKLCMWISSPVPWTKS